jgi:anaerobic selenocysteine-containing dehydrogenase
MLGLQIKPYIQATKPLLEPKGEQRDEATIYLDLAKASGISIFGSPIAQKLLEWTKWWHSLRKRKGKQPAVPQEGILSLILRLTRQGGFKSLLKHRHGKLRKEHQPGDFLGQRVYTENGKIQLAPPLLMEQTKRLELDFHKEIAAQDQFRLITKRHVTTHNSWTHNFEDFVKGERESNYVYMHSSDGERLGLNPKDLADVSSETGTIRLPVKYLDDLMPGTVAVPHGWGHQSSRMGVAGSTKGVNVNILAADGPEALEPVSGMARLTGIPVTVRPAAGDQAKSWSGLEKDKLIV